MVIVVSFQSDAANSVTFPPAVVGMKPPSELLMLSDTSVVTSKPSAASNQSNQLYYCTRNKQQNTTEFRWMCGVKLQDRVPSKELRGRLELEDIISVLQRNRLRWYGHVLRKEDNDWVKKCMEYEVEGTRPGGR